MSREASLAIVLVMLAAGCLSSAPAGVKLPGEADAALAAKAVFHKAGGALIQAPADMPLARGGQYSLGVDSSEPTIGVSPQGAIFMTGYHSAPTGNGPTIMRSLDQGQSWEDVGPPLTHPRSFDPYVYVDPDTGRVFMDDIWPLSCTTLSWSDDAGATWTTNPYACGNTQVNDHQTIATAKPRMLPVTPLYPKLVYTCTNNVGYTGCATSLNGGVTFGPQVPIVDTAKDNCGASTGHLEPDFEGRMYAGLVCAGNAPAVAVTEDDGLTWTHSIVSADHPNEPSDHDVELATDEAGNVYAVWAADDGLLWYAFSTDHAKTWSDAKMIAAPGVTAIMFSSAASRAVGTLAFAYVGTTIEGGYEGRERGNAGLEGDLLGQPTTHDWDGATWNGYIGVMMDALSDDPIMQSVTANDPADPLARGLCGGTRCHGMNDFIDLVVDPEGRPWVAFVDVCTAECVTDPTLDADVSVGFAGTLVQGPALVTGSRELAPLAPPPR